MSVLAALILALGWAASSAQATTTTFLYTGAEQTFVVPGGVTSVHVVAIGGSGGAATDASGGVAAEAIGNVNVTPGQTLYVEVGGKGKGLGEGGQGGFNGGASGAGGGGGASDIRTSPRELGLAPDHRLIVAAGGGGAGGSGPNGPGAEGGAAGSPGGASEFYGGGGAGTATEGGLGASGCFGSGENGQLGSGGAGNDSGAESDPGGGGAGGYYGGGGGGGSCEFGSSGGGGGSLLIPVGGSAALASLATEPRVQITYTLVPPSIAIVSPAGGATYTQGQVIKANYSCTPPEGTVVETCAGPVASGAALDTAALGKHTFTVSAEDADGATASQEVSYNVVAAPSPPPPPIQPIPNTLLDSHPKTSLKTKKKATVKFSFSSDIAGATFQCQLDKGQFSPCASPQTYKKVKAGQHTFSVQAVAGGVVDPTPATFSFRVTKIKKHKKKH